MPPGVNQIAVNTYDLWQATPSTTTKQTTPYAKNYGLQAYWTR